MEAPAPVDEPNPSPHEGVPQTGPARVLIVDDDPSMRALLRAWLRRNELYRIVGEAEDGVSAIEEARRLRPDLVLLDVQMPRMGGFEALPKIREASPGTQIVILSGLERSLAEPTAVRLSAAAAFQKDSPLASLGVALAKIIHRPRLASRARSAHTSDKP